MLKACRVNDTTNGNQLSRSILFVFELEGQSQIAVFHTANRRRPFRMHILFFDKITMSVRMSGIAYYYVNWMACWSRHSDIYVLIRRSPRLIEKNDACNVFQVNANHLDNKFRLWRPGHTANMCLGCACPSMGAHCSHPFHFTSSSQSHSTRTQKTQRD